MRLPTRAALASSFRFALGLVTLAVLLVGSNAPAAADPTGSPSSTALPAASPTPSTDTPTPTPTAMASASATSSPTTSDITPTSASSTSAAADSRRPAELRAAKVPVAAGAGITSLRARLPAKLRRVAALAVMTKRQDAKAAAAAAPALEDDRLAISVISRCAQGSTQTSADVAALLVADVQLSVSYVVRDGENVPVAQGSFTLVPGGDLDFADFTVAGLSAGGHHLDLFAGDVETPTASLDFDIIGCVATTIACQAITFSNPASNPAVEVNIFGDDPDGGSSDVAFTLTPGAARTVRTGRAIIDWFAGVGAGTDLSQIIALAGAANGVSIPQGCGDPSSSVRIGCAAAGGGSAKVTLLVDHLPEETVEWAILDTFRTEVASGRVSANGRTSDRFRALLPGAGRYQYLLHVNGTRDALESFDFAVRACVRAGLADTGATDGAVPGVILGLLLVTTGTGLARRC
jgi:hypothetical protein